MNKKLAYVTPEMSCDLRAFIAADGWDGWFNINGFRIAVNRGVQNDGEEAIEVRGNSQYFEFQVIVGKQDVYYRGLNELVETKNLEFILDFCLNVVVKDFEILDVIQSVFHKGMCDGVRSERNRVKEILGLHEPPYQPI